MNLFLFLTFLSCQDSTLDWQEGDILFQDGECGDFCEAIRKVTEGYEGREFTHNGLLINENGKWYVLEATSQGVSQTPLHDFLERHLDHNGRPKVMLGRLKPEYQHLISQALEEAKKQIGKPYDAAFDFDNDAFYCSELIHFAFKVANDGDDLFTPQPMTFRDPKTKKLFPIWKTYFEELGIPVPEGQMGLNPGGMSLDPVLKMRTVF
ncbi:YiiX/YebB-like N1pC/P60 family cysteine hydrolase [Pararhodonellum marinum]|uniref:YiiX/YebB-like N1pC/P60 family cysteine hydrolase n=1 Tax=Pararhodonellum marinum TaxID=2755358 RepID=UPI001E549E63|nr:YiiX/YebB-like N1pC/P60 family cysteine hydrolase [Pararhodonellum marinum]